jgi:hypothetical protein
VPNANGSGAQRPRKREGDFSYRSSPAPLATAEPVTGSTSPLNLPRFACSNPFKAQPAKCKSPALSSHPPRSEPLHSARPAITCRSIPASSIENMVERSGTKEASEGSYRGISSFSRYPRQILPDRHHLAASLNLLRAPAGNLASPPGHRTEKVPSSGTGGESPS